jgi:ice-binding like protein
MRKIGSSRASPKLARYFWLTAIPVVAGVTALFTIIQSSGAAVTAVDLGTAGSFAVLAGTTVTNTGPSTIQGDLGVSPGSAVTGFPPGTVTGGAIHAADGVAAGAQTDLTTAYTDAASRTATDTLGAFIGNGQTLDSGVYNASSSLEVGGALTLDAQGDPSAVFIFQAGSTLVTDSASIIVLTGDAQACNVFWQVGSSATLGTSSSFSGSILALTSITVTTGDNVAGRVLARNGAVTLDSDTITAPAACPIVAPTPSPSPTTTPTTPPPSPTTTPTTPPPSPTTTPTTPPTTPPPSPTAAPTTVPPPSPTAAPTVPPPSPTAAPTVPPPSPTSPPTVPPPSPTSPPSSTGPHPAPIPSPVPTTFPVTG